MIEFHVFTILAFTCILGGIIHSISGVAFAIPVVPVLAYFVPEHIPVTTLFLGLAISITLLVDNYKKVRWSDVKYLLPARFTGSIPAAIILTILNSTKEITIVVAVLLLVSIIITAFKFTFKLSKANLIIAGFFSGLIATLASLGGGPIAILYKDHDRNQVKATISFIFVAGIVFSLLLLIIVGHLKITSFYLSIQLLPFLIIGYFLGKRLDKYVPSTTMKPIVLIFGSLATIVVIFKAILLY